MPTHDTVWFTPPAPLVQVRLRNWETGTEVTEVPMLLNTGADVSLVPRSCVTTLGLALDPQRRYELVRFDDTVSTAPVMSVRKVGAWRRNLVLTVLALGAGVVLGRAFELQVVQRDFVAAASDDGIHQFVGARVVQML